MLVRLLCLVLLAVGTMAGDFTATWPAGKAEKLSYSMTIYAPSEMTSNAVVSISRTTGAVPAFQVIQTLDIPTQQAKIVSSELYQAADLKLISSQNVIYLPPEAKAQMGVDSLVITATGGKDSVDISSNVAFIPAGKIAWAENLTTSVGLFFTSRNYDFKPGLVRHVNIINLISFNGRPFESYPQIDSLIGEESVTVPAGTFTCHKLKSQGTGSVVNYTYYSNDKKRLPIMYEATDPTSGKTIAKLTLQKVE
jgi:hypothetical protein